MKFSEKLANLGKLDKFKTKSREELAEIAYNQTAKQVGDLRQRLSKLEDRQNTSQISVEVSTDGELRLNQMIKSESGIELSGKKLLYSSESLKSLANLLRPLMAATKALYRSNGLIKSQELYEMTNGTINKNQRLRNGNNEELFHVDPLSQLKFVCNVLDHNEQAKKALAAITGILEEYTVERLKSLEVTEASIKATSDASLHLGESRVKPKDPAPKTR